MVHYIIQISHSILYKKKASTRSFEIEFKIHELIILLALNYFSSAVGTLIMPLVKLFLALKPKVIDLLHVR